MSEPSAWSADTEPALIQIERECAADGWDGPGSILVSPRTLEHAAKLIEFLAGVVSSEISAPDVVPEADGDVSLSWYGDQHTTFSVSIGSHGCINFAGLFGDQGAVHGWERVNFDSALAWARAGEQLARHLTRLARSAGRSH